MWQEIVVGMAVAASATYAGFRVLRIFRNAKTDQVSCTCDCPQCGQKCDPEAPCEDLLPKGPGSRSA
jgi:hypothetical protein